MLKNKNFDFVGNLPKYLIASAAIMVISLVICFVFGPVVDISFSGGTRITYSYEGDIDTNAVATIVETTVGKKVSVDTTSGVNDSSQKMVISLADKDALSTESIDSIDTALTDDEAFSANNLVQAEVNSVNPTVGAVFFAKCLVAVLIAAVLVIIYVTIRFRKIGGLTAGVTALIALVHDILIAFFVAVIFRLNIDSNFIAVVMTLLGYSLNNTIVVFDRVRENRRAFGSKHTLAETVNISNNQVLSRNIMTTVSTFIAIFIVLIVCEVKGITSLRSLTIPLCFGLVSGAYSSICIAPSLWVKWKNRIDAKKSAAKKGVYR